MKKRCLTLLLALAICLALAVPAYAASGLKLGTALNGQTIVTGWDGPYGSHVTIPNGVAGINTRALENCGITSVTIPNSMIWFGKGAFSGSHLTEVTIPGSVRSTGEETFVSCSSLKSVTILYGTSSIGDGSFHMCTSLTSVTLPDSLLEIGSKAFRGCDKLTEVTIPNSVTSIGSGAFAYCDSLTSVTLPISVTSIRRDTFYRCKNLTSVAIPSTVTRIENGAFKECSSLTDVYYGGSEAQWKAVNINNDGNGNDPLRNATIHYNTGVIPTFSDVPTGSWYAEAVDWAVEMDITAGTGGGKFSPKQTCTHGQILTFLWRSLGEPWSDVEPPIAMKGDEYYYEAVRWAAENDMIGGDFDPNASCNRAYAVFYIWQTFGRPAPSGESPFTDVPAHWSSAPAAAWAAEQGITTGTSATTFDPGKICSRGEIVTFLYRAYN